MRLFAFCGQRFLLRDHSEECLLFCLLFGPEGLRAIMGFFNYALPAVTSRGDLIVAKNSYYRRCETVNTDPL